MCGRYVLYGPEGRILDGFSLFELPPFTARYNIAPTTPVLTVLPAADGTRQARMLRWGLIPHWARDPSIGARLNNARADGVNIKPSFRTAWRRSRCLLPADGFYEWQTLSGPGKPRKQPWYIHSRDATLLAMAGLYERWEGPDGVIESCCVITTDANALMRPIHDRMPVLVPPAEHDRWLHTAPAKADTLLPLLVPAPDDDALCADAVSTEVNAARTDHPGLIAPIRPRTPF